MQCECVRFADGNETTPPARNKITHLSVSEQSAENDALIADCMCIILYAVCVERTFVVMYGTAQTRKPPQLLGAFTYVYMTYYLRHTHTRTRLI